MLLAMTYQLNILPPLPLKNYPPHKQWHSDWFLCILSSEFKTRYYPDENVRFYPITVSILDFIIGTL